MVKLTKQQEIGVKLLATGKLDTKDIKYLRDHCLKEKGWSDLTEDEIIKLNPRTLTQGQKSWRTWLIHTRIAMEEAVDFGNIGRKEKGLPLLEYKNGKVIESAYVSKEDFMKRKENMV